MYTDLGFSLTRDCVRAASAPEILTVVRTWLQWENPICLIHPHGFYVVLLSRNATDDWRFHFWPKGPRTITGMSALIHTHDRHVESRVLQGQLTNILYDVAVVENGGQPIYEVDYVGDRYAANTSNSLRLTTTRVQPLVSRRETMTCGEIYQVERHVYHEATVSEEFATATLVCMHGHSPGAVKVVGLDGYPEIVTFKRVEYRANAFVEQLST